MTAIGPATRESQLYGPHAYPHWLDDEPEAPHRACRGKDPEIWFPEHGGNATVAKAICAACPVLDPCRAWALRQPLGVLHGVWGGTSWYERKRTIGGQA